jgi:hypothetical protein
MTRSTIAILACSLLGCASPAAAPAPPPASPSITDPRPGATAELTGILSRKGPAETSFWGVTDPAGKLWEIVEVTPQLEARFRDLQNGQVTFQVERRGRALFEQVRVIDVVRPAR